jgi:hypothetical protein
MSDCRNLAIWPKRDRHAVVVGRCCQADRMGIADSDPDCQDEAGLRRITDPSAIRSISFTSAAGLTHGMTGPPSDLMAPLL